MHKNKQVGNTKGCCRSEVSGSEGIGEPGVSEGRPKGIEIRHEHHHDGNSNGWRENLKLLVALCILLTMLTLNYGWQIRFSRTFDLSIYTFAYLLAGWNVLKLAYAKLKKLDIFNEFFLMSVATLGAFTLGEYSEAVAVMVFYSIGEWFQDSAVTRAKKSIRALLDIRPERVSVFRNGKKGVHHPSEVAIGETVEVKPGEKVALDGILRSEIAFFNTAALTGESTPVTKCRGDAVFAGMVNLNTVAAVEVTELFKNSKLSKIVEMVQDATARKSRTQRFISQFAKVYTPIVFFLALAICLLPFFFLSAYDFNTWFYRSLVFLVISCPCALVVSIPLGYFGGIGLASRNGVLFKGGNFLDLMAKIDTVVLDKTGTITKGVFKVQEVVAIGMEKSQLIQITSALEKSSTHPVAKAITEFAGGGGNGVAVENVMEIPGYGLKGTINGKEVLAGNLKLIQKFSIGYPSEIKFIVDTIVVVAIDESFAGYFRISDELKAESADAVRQLQDRIQKVVLLSGDKQSVVDQVAKKLGIETAFGDLLPEDKVGKLQRMKDSGRQIAFVGDGVNDAPVIALADVGIAMGGLGSDAAIETADVVIQDDKLTKILCAIKIGRITRSIVWQNIGMAIIVKLLVLALGAGGIASLWEAVIADVGVALLAILNAVRIQQMKI